MSKRKAEDILSCCPTSKRFISLFVDCKSVNPLLSRERTKRKLHEAELGPQPDYKRVEGASRGPNLWDRSASRGPNLWDRSASRGPNPWDRSTSGAAGAPAVRETGTQERRGTRTSSSSLTGSALPAARPPNVPGDEVSFQYNSFQFWRVPLPKIELAEIEDIGDMKMIEEMNCDIPEEATEIEMELQN
ncbi:uncharacterized protein [Mobula birostris]|uniref:uncharacterized protein n=1 Tax=Mobula birostris TaxID=1983395 RepID=UPI003B27CB79